MAVHTSSKHHDHHHDLITMAGYIGGIFGAILGLGAGFVADIHQVINNGAENAGNLAGVPPMLCFVGMMLGYALGACLAVCVQTIGSIECPCTRSSADTKLESNAASPQEDPEPAMG